MYGHDESSTRYSPLSQINTQNVLTLTRAWTYHMKKEGPRPMSAGAVGRGGGRRTSQATPIVVNGKLYMPTPYSTVIALDPETGQELWSFKLDHGRPAGRGVAYWHGDAKTPASILFGTSDGRLMSINAQTGKPTAGFGVNGAVDIKTDVQNGFPNAQFDVTSPVSIYKDLAILGGQIQESPGTGASGDPRAWDVHTGKLVWRFHSVPHAGETGNDTWEGMSWKNRSGTNVWGLMSVDLEQGLVFFPFGSPAYDFYGADPQRSIPGLDHAFPATTPERLPVGVVPGPLRETDVTGGERLIHPLEIGRPGASAGIVWAPWRERRHRGPD